mmetsp:Transcript_25994/g.52334  ORF Transcript_25994/g.52334 Transcript_25994/m.52334 type:complete len:82 (+) Transcript_25994:81-326(+)
MSKMSLPPRQHNEQQQVFLRQATILRKNLGAWDATLRSARGGDWPSMLGRLNAAFVSNVEYITKSFVLEIITLHLLLPSPE